MNLSIEQEDDLRRQRTLAEEMFPAEWEAARRIANGEKRRRRLKALRDRADHEMALRPLREAGKSCGNCAKTRPAADVLGDRYKGQRYCREQSDHEGYVLVKPTGLCRWHKDAPR